MKEEINAFKNSFEQENLLGIYADFHNIVDYITSKANGIKEMNRIEDIKKVFNCLNGIQSILMEIYDMLKNPDRDSIYDRLDIILENYCTIEHLLL